MTVLIVDDNEQNREMLQVLLGGSGYQVVLAVQGAEALALARQTPPDLIISDILMPVMDGFALCREWNQDERLRSIPFIFYTATYTDERDMDFALRLGAAEFIVKPADPDVFLTKIKDVIRRVDRKRMPPAPEPVDSTAVQEAGYLKQYNETLIRKLEAKMQQLELTNRELEKHLGERQNTENMLERERSLYRDLVNALPAGTYRLRISPAAEWHEGNWESQMRSHYSADMVSDRFCDILGITRQEFEANPHIVPNRIHPDDHAEFIRKNAEAIAELSPFSWEGRILAPGKECVWVRFESIPRGLENGETVWTGIVADITERKQAEEKLKQQLDELRRWHDVTLDREGRIAHLKHEVNELLARLNEPPRYAEPDARPDKEAAS